MGSIRRSKINKTFVLPPQNLYGRRQNLLLILELIYDAHNGIGRGLPIFPSVGNGHENDNVENDQENDTGENAEKEIHYDSETDDDLR